jgi:hypothetical protein
MANQAIYSGKWSSSGKDIKVNLPLILFEEDNVEVVYCPALDISGYGKTEKEAMDSFTVALGEFLLYTTHKNTFFSELSKIGWKVKKNKPMTPPPMSKLLESNDNFSRIFNEHSFRKIDHSFALPMA